MIEISIKTKAERPDEDLVGCVLSIEFETTTEEVGKLIDQIKAMNTSDPSTTIELGTTVSIGFHCSICGKKAWASYNKAPPRCSCNPHARWIAT